MSMFGDSDDETDDINRKQSDLEHLWRHGLARAKLTITSPKLVIDKRCALVHSDTFQSRFELSKFINKYERGGFHQAMPTYVLNREPKQEGFDVVIYVTEYIDDRFDEYLGNEEWESLNVHFAEQRAMELLRPGGLLVALLRNEQDMKWFDEDFGWKVGVKGGASGPMCVVNLTKTSVRVNSEGCEYWGGYESYLGLQDEQSRVADCTVYTTVEEKEKKILSAQSKDRAIRILKEHGVLVLPGLLDEEPVLSYGRAALADMHQATMQLRGLGIDLFRPGSGLKIENYHELGMREALRCDLRNGKQMKAVTAELRGQLYHPAIEDILAEVMHSPSAYATPFPDRGNSSKQEIEAEARARSAARGNWGLWNFEGQGPEGPKPKLRVGDFGCVMSLPGCVDQTIHADTPHLYTHTQLPGHYFNLFLVAAEKKTPAASFDCGQTCFIQGSHELETCCDIMAGSGGQAALVRRLLRPHLVAGDALVFDCRILHCGLANRTGPVASLGGEVQPPQTGGFRRFDAGGIVEEGSEGGTSHKFSVPRPLLYCNYTREFFEDPKNWRNKEKLF